MFWYRLSTINIRFYTIIVFYSIMFVNVAIFVFAVALVTAPTMQHEREIRRSLSYILLCDSNHALLSFRYSLKYISPTPGIANMRTRAAHDNAGANKSLCKASTEGARFASGYLGTVCRFPNMTTRRTRCPPFHSPLRGSCLRIGRE